VRQAVWRARIARGVDRDLVLRARQGCELKTAVEQRTLVDLMLGAEPDGLRRIELSRSLEEAGEVSPAAWIKSAAIRDASSPEELERLRTALIVSEPHVQREFEKQYRAATTHALRLAVVRRFLRLAPHAAYLRRRLLALLEAVGDHAELANFVHALRADPFADAALLAEGAAALRRAGQGMEGVRAFGEIVERAPEDPYARALVGDRLRDEGLFDDAVATYAALEALLPADPAVSARVALAHAGAGRLDVATRHFTRIVESPGRGADAELGALSSVLASVLIAEARKTGGAAAPALERRALEVPLPDVQGLLLVRTPSLFRPVRVRVARGTGPATDLVRGAEQAPLVAPSLGLAGGYLERGDEALWVLLSRAEELPPERPVPVRVDLLLLDGDRRPVRLVTREVVLPADGKDQSLAWRGGEFE
jgi:Ca-activated chloride channel family protein